MLVVIRMVLAPLPGHVREKFHLKSILESFTRENVFHREDENFALI